MGQTSFNQTDRAIDYEHKSLISVILLEISVTHMPRFAANLTMMFPEFDLKNRFAKARALGFKAVELLQPYSESIADIKKWLNENQLEIILINTPMGRVKKGERGLACLPGRETDFKASFRLALSYALDLEVRMVHVMAGIIPSRTELAACEEVLIDNLKWASDLVSKYNIILMLEPLNHYDVPGYFYSRAEEAAKLIQKLNRENIRMQYDLYHLQLSQGHLVSSLREHFDIISHVQFSSVPGRYEPQYGEVNLPFLFDLLDELGYLGWVGCEYRPKFSTIDGLSWARPYGLGEDGSLS